MSETVITVPEHNVDAMQKNATTINFVANDSKNDKAPKFYAMVSLQGELAGMATPIAVFIKDGVPSSKVPSIYGSASLQVNQITEVFNNHVFHRDDPEGRDRLNRLDAAIRIAYYGWVKDGGKPQTFSL